MADPTITTRRYFARPSFSFFCWTDDGEVIAWESGQTIGFKEEVLHVLEHLAPQGLPPFEAVVMLLAACRDGWHRELEEVRSFRFLSDMVRPNWIGDILDGLDAVHELDAAIRHTLPGKALLAETVFEKHPPKVNADDAASIVAHLSRGLWSDLLSDSSSREMKTGDLVPMLEALWHGLPGISDETLKNRRDIGLDQLVAPADVELFPQERARQLISQLMEDSELSGIGGVAHDLMAAVHVPHAIERQSELPVGGVSDITNRGELDRLLISELANDDLLLAVRVATNEAMYLRREAPPGTPPKMRTILVDTNLRLWGAPRVFAASVALALVATGDRHCDEYRCFSTNDQRIDAVDLLSREGLMKLLGGLHPGRHPAESLKQFLDDTADLHADAVLITSEDTWEDDAFRLAMMNDVDRSFYVATVSRRGRYRLHTVTPSGTSRINEAEIELDRLLSNEPPTPEAPVRRQPMLRDQPNLDDYPAIYRADPFPLRIGYPVDNRTTWAVSDTKIRRAMMVTRDGLLLMFDQQRQPGIQLMDRLPSTRLRWFGHTIENGMVYAVIGTFQTRLYLLRINVITHDVQCIDLEYGPEARGLPNQSKLPRDQRGRGVYIADGVVVVAYRKHINVLDMTTGELIRSQKIPDGVIWHDERFYRSKGFFPEWYRMTFDGETSHFEWIEKLEQLACMHVFERAGMDGVVGVGSGIVFTATGHVEPVERAITQAYHTKNGSRLTLKLMSEHRSSAIVNHWRFLAIKPNQAVDNANVPVAYVHRGRVVDPEVNHFDIPNNARRHFDEIGITTDGKLCLLRNTSAFTLELYGESDSLYWKEHHRNAVTCNHRRWFNPAARPDGVRFWIRKALWSKAGEVFVDARGLLHLIPKDKAISELTMVMLQWNVAGWTPDGRQFGLDYYFNKRLDPHTHVSASEIFEQIIQPFLQPLT